MKILLVSPLPPPVGGIATWTTLFTEYCERERHTVRVVNTALIGKRSEQKQGKTYIIDELKRNTSILFRVKKEIEEFQPDVVYINTSCSKTGLIRDAYSAFLARKEEIVVHCHCDIEEQVKNNSLAIRLLKYLIHRATHVFVLNTTSRHYIESIGCSTAKIVPNFVKDRYVIPSRRIADNIERVIFVGHVVKAKGLSEIIEAAQAFPGINFGLAGPVIDNIDEYSVPSNVKFLGRKTPDEVREELNKSDIFLFPSYSEGFSLALLEAMAMGLPAIVTDVGANRDMIENRGGIVIDVADSRQIVNAIENMESSSTRKKMSDWNISKVLNSYTCSRVVGGILEIIKGEVK